MDRKTIAADAVDSGQFMEISWMGPPFFAGAQEGLWVETMLEERFNVDLKPIFMDPNAYDRKKPLMIASGNVPDLIWEANPISLQKAVHHGFVAEIPLELIARHMPTYYRELTRDAPVAWLYSRVDGGNFGLPTMNRKGAEPKPGIWRMDWLRAGGFEEQPQTLEEFEAALRYISHGDPDGNGIDDTYGMSGDISNWWWVSFSEIFGAFGVLPFDWQEVDGQIVWGGTRPEARQALELLRRWYAEGLIHPEFVTDSMLPGQSLDRKFLSGRTGYIYYRGENWNLDFSQSGSFAFNFLNLQFENLLQQTDELADRLLEEVPRALIFYALREELITRTRDIGTYVDGVNQTVAKWILNTSFRDRLLSDTLFDAEGSSSSPDVPRVDISAHQRFFIDLRHSILTEVLAGLTRQHYAAFSAWAQQRIRAIAAADGLDLSSPDAALRRSALSRLFTGRALDEFVREAFQSLVDRGMVTLLPSNVRFRSLMIGHYGLLQARGVMEPALKPAYFPEGPEGHRGGRAWGTASNILTFGAHLQDDPAKVVRLLDMIEAIYTDPVLAKESISGREGIHWEWLDPVLRENATKGSTLKPDYLNPATGQMVDLSSGSTSMRFVLNANVGYFNLVGVTKDFEGFYSGTEAKQFKDDYQRPEWGLVNALGKSDVVPSASDYLSDLRMRQQTVYAEIIRGSVPMEAFDAFAKEWLERGGEQLLREANDLHQQFRQILEEVRGVHE